MFEPHGLRLVCRFNLGGDTRMTGPELTVPADRTSDRDHGQSSKPDSVRAQTHQLDRVRAGAYAAIRPDLHFSAQTRFTQRAMRIHNSNFGRQTHIAQGMRTRRASSAIVSGQIDNICICFGNADRDNADARDDRNLHSHARLWD